MPPRDSRRSTKSPTAAIERNPPTSPSDGARVSDGARARQKQRPSRGPETSAAAPAAPRPVRSRDGAFGFDPDTAVAHLRAADPALARLIDDAGPFAMELKRTPSVFGALAEAIVYQQLTGKAAATIYARICALFPHARVGFTAEDLLVARDEALRGAGLSRGKLLALRDLAARAVDGRLPTLAAVRRLDDAAIVERLTEVRGVGRWTAEMFLMFRLGRPDVLPTDDYGVRKGFALTFRKGAVSTPEQLARRGARWRPYRSVASWYLWRAAERGAVYR
jgi:3-methyladenine DNA glycosylase/8-oxoguanine DNA glycosylase